MKQYVKILFTVVVVQLLSAKSFSQNCFSVSIDSIGNGMYALHAYNDHESVSPDPSITWTIDDTTYYYDTVVIHHFQFDGPHRIRLRVYDTLPNGYGCIGYDDSLYVRGAPLSYACHVSTGVDFVNIPNPVFTIFNDDDTSVYTYEWKIDGTLFSTVKNPSFNLSQGVHNIFLSLTDSFNCTYNQTIYYPVHFDSTLFQSCSIEFMFDSIHDWNDSFVSLQFQHAGANFITAHWFFNWATVYHIASSGGFLYSASPALGDTTDIWILLQDADSCWSMDSRRVIFIHADTIIPPIDTSHYCHAHFDIAPVDSFIIGMDGLYLGVNNSTGTYLNFLWSFGDGQTSTDQYPIHNYAIPGVYMVCLTISDTVNGCTSSFCDSSFYVFKTEGGLMSQLIIQAPTGIPQFTIPNFKFQISPNPTTDQLHISIDEGLVGEQLNIYNTTGALLQSVLLATNNTQLSTNNLLAGIYIAEIKTKEASVKKRWVKM